jgi:hypothetical protein
MSEAVLRQYKPCNSSCEENLRPRLFLCGRCRNQVHICRGCDRGQVYCGRDCALEERRSRQREARRRYQASERGRQMHADRSRQYRARGRRVTDQGPILGTKPAKQPEPAHPAAITAQPANIIAGVRVTLPSLRPTRLRSGPHGANSSAAQTPDRSLHGQTGTSTSANNYGFRQALTAGVDGPKTWLGERPHRDQATACSSVGGDCHGRRISTFPAIS